MRLPWEASEIVGFVKGEDEKDGKETFTYCMERLDTEDLVNDLGVEADPDGIDKDLLADPDALRATSFQCRRYDDEQAVEDQVWERILPRPYYELTWRQPAGEASSPPVSE